VALPCGLRIPSWFRFSAISSSDNPFSLSAAYPEPSHPRHGRSSAVRPRASRYSSTTRCSRCRPRTPASRAPRRSATSSQPNPSKADSTGSDCSPSARTHNQPSPPTPTRAKPTASTPTGSWSSPSTVTRSQASPASQTAPTCSSGSDSPPSSRTRSERTLAQPTGLASDQDQAGMVAPTIRPRFSGAKNSFGRTVPATTPKKRFVSSLFVRSAAKSVCCSAVGGASVANS